VSDPIGNEDNEELDAIPDEGLTEEDIRQKFEEASNEIGRFNLAIFGQTGVGKGTLINALFGKEVAETGMGRPVTQEGHLYVHETERFGLYDTRGLEISDDPELLLDEFAQYLDETRDKPLSDQIHLAYYCVNVHSTRLQHQEDKFIQGLRQLGLPVILVVTKCDSSEAGELREDLQIIVNAIEAEAIEADLDIFDKKTFPICSLKSTYSTQYGLAELLDATFRAAPEGVEAALSAAQVLDRDRKSDKAQTDIAFACTAAGVAAFSPIPFSDAPILAGIQLAMMGRISAAYGISVSTSTQAAVVASGAATAVGKSLVAGLIKLIPGLGTVAGGVINSAVATSLTLAMGQTWNKICQMDFDGEIDLEKIANHELVKIFKDLLKRWWSSDN